VELFSPKLFSPQLFTAKLFDEWVELMSLNGSLVDALDAAINTLAASSTFQGRCGKSSASDAEDCIFLDVITDDQGLENQRPFALLKIATRGSNQVAEGVAVDLVAGGGVIVYLTDNARSDASHKLSYRDFLRFAGKVMDEMEEDSGFGDYLPFHDAEMILPPQRTPRSERQARRHDYWEVAFLLNFGDRE
jgi:hypothetical protein